MTPSDFSLAEVAVALPVDGTFHYLIPPGLNDRIKPGLRVLVPFGRRLVTGYVLGRLESSGRGRRPSGPIGPELKEIARVLDEEPFFGADLLDLFRFVSGYYHYPLGQVIAEALPTGLKVESLRRASITAAGREALDRPNLTGKEADFLKRLVRAGGLSLARLSREKGEILSLLRRFEGLGWAVVETHLSRDRVKPRSQTWLSPARTADKDRVRLGGRERELLDLLAKQGPTAADDLRPGFPTLNLMIPRLIGKGLLLTEDRILYRDDLGRALTFTRGAPELTEEQVRAVSALTAALERGRFAPFVLRGITGSGKTEVYLAAARQALDRGRTVLYLVPEISLTPALEGLLNARFQEEAAILHSGLSEGRRYDQWLKIIHRKARLVLGARSAVFAPLADPGLIIVDEEHDGAYKQEDKLKYQARDLALYRGRQHEAVVVLGSATPSLESFQAARSGRYHLLTLTERPGPGNLPRVDVVDLRFASGRRRTALTPMLKTALAETLAQGRQALLFINRRGLAGLALCLNCGYVVRCLNCSVALTPHQAPAADGRPGLILGCHHCGLEMKPPEQCPECRSGLVRYLGWGTERVENEVRKAFPEARVGRLDADTARPKGELTRILAGLRDQALDVLVGTQMVTKGHDFPHITLVGVIEADLGLHLPDFRAAERGFQLLAQVAGRTGRGQDPGRVIIQTYSPEHYTLLLARKHDYLGFFQQEIEQRLAAGYPPFTRLALVRFQGNSESVTASLARAAAESGRRLVQTSPRPGLDILGPAPAPLAKVKGRHRFQILVRSPKVKTLHAFLRDWLEQVRPTLKGQAVSLSLDVDPYHMM
ncbi:MAG: primosomal protein N' [Thermodesulfobacteriota bacterium]